MIPRSLKLIAWIAIVEGVGFAAAALGGLVGENPWFDELPKPAFWPPTLVFPLAWSLVNYPSLAIATWRVWSIRRKKTIAPQLAIFVVVMLVNAAFGFVVNRAKRTDVYVLMDALGVGTALALFVGYRSVDRRAGIVTLPYVAWCIYTTAIKISLHRHRET
jgi:tryptophan-rich sensory protein